MQKRFERTLLTDAPEKKGRKKAARTESREHCYIFIKLYGRTEYEDLSYSYRVGVRVKSDTWEGVRIKSDTWEGVRVKPDLGFLDARLAKFHGVRPVRNLLGFLILFRGGR